MDLMAQTKELQAVFGAIATLDPYAPIATVTPNGVTLLQMGEYENVSKHLSLLKAVEYARHRIWELTKKPAIDNLEELPF